MIIKLSTKYKMNILHREQITENKGNYLISIPNDKLCIIICANSENRKIIHQYIDNMYPKLKKTSLHTNCYSAYRGSTWIECYYCDYKSVPINTYHCGITESNIDEYRSGICPKCDEIIIWEPNYDGCDNVRRKYKNNMIVIGEYIQFNKCNYAEYADISHDKFNEILNSCTMFEIYAPKLVISKYGNIHKLSKRKLMEYIDEKIRDQFMN